MTKEPTTVEHGPAQLAGTPREHVAELVALIGEPAATRCCLDLLAGGHPDSLMRWLGGPAAQSYIGLADLGVNAFWPRVWGARGLLYCWTPDAATPVLVGLGDQAWRVREMCAKVALLREIAGAAGTLIALAGDAVPRVRIAALRALAAVGEASTPRRSGPPTATKTRPYAGPPTLR